MDFISGGAYNGKKEWVKRTYDFEEGNFRHVWIDGKISEARLEVMEEAMNEDTSLLIFSGVEWVVKQSLMTPDGNGSKLWENFLSKAEEYEHRNPRRQIVFIGTDLTKGVVPIDREQREWRDMVGWCYQVLMKKSQCAYLIWFGIEQCVKGGIK